MRESWESGHSFGAVSWVITPSKCGLSISKIASVVDKLRWARSIIWGLWGNWFAEIEAWSLIRERLPCTQHSLYSESSVSSSAQGSNTGHSWALFPDGCIVTPGRGHQWGVMIGLMLCRWNVNVAPIAHRPPGTTQELGSWGDIFTQFYTRLVPGVLTHNQYFT